MINYSEEKKKIIDFTNKNKLIFNLFFFYIFTQIRMVYFPLFRIIKLFSMKTHEFDNTFKSKLRIKR